MQEKLKQQTANVTKQKNKKNNNFISGIDKLTSKKEKDINKQKQLKLQNEEKYKRNLRRNKITKGT